jgi:hypothetical protein
MFSNNVFLFFNNYLLAQELQLLVKTNINLNAKNLENKTALDLAVEVEIKTILMSAKAKYGSEVPVFTDYQILAYYLKSFPTRIDEFLIYLSRFRSGLSDEERNTYMIIFTLIATAAYGAAQSPTGGVYQANASNNDTAGTSVMSQSTFMSFTLFNILSFLMSMISIIILTPRRGSHIFFPIYCLALSYLYSMIFISPTYINARVVAIFYISVWVGWTIAYIIIPMYSTRVNMRKAMTLNRRGRS